MTQSDKDFIFDSFKYAKDKDLQIEILSDMFLCPKKDIKDLLGIETKSNKKYRSDIKNKAFNMIENGVEYTEISEALGLDVRTLRKWKCENFNYLIEEKRKHWDLKKQKAKELYLQGLKTSEICSRLNIKINTFNLWRRKGILNS